MSSCVYCGEALGSTTHPPEHILPAAVGGTVITGKVCGRCNQRAGSEVDQPWLEFGPVMEQRHRHRIPDRDGKQPRPVRWPGTVTGGGGRPAVVEVDGANVNVRPLPSEREEGDMRVIEGIPDDLAKRRKRILRDTPDAELRDLPSMTLDAPLSATVEWQLDVNVWPRFAAKVALGVASLLADDSWASGARAAELRDVLWHGHGSTPDEPTRPGRAWSYRPHDLGTARQPLRPPEHLLTLESGEGTTWVSLITFAAFAYSVPIGIAPPSADRPIAWLIDPVKRTHVALTAEELRTEYSDRGFQ